MVEPHLGPGLRMLLDSRVRVDDPQSIVLLPAVVLPGAPQLLLHNALVFRAVDVMPALEHGGIREEGLLPNVVANVHHLLVVVEEAQ